ncbi:MAG: hypothetical protein ABR899_02970 [Candidatus Krumholzibacteriaceae bacterium]|jgi:hypothetical protein
MKRLIVPLLFSCLLASRAEARFEDVSAVARSQAVGGAFVSLADDASALFVNPAGIVLAGPFAGYFDYDEPAGASAAGTWESRLAACMAAGRTSFGLGWYSLERGGGGEDLLLAGAAYRLLEGTEGSLISFGANAAVGHYSSSDGIVCLTGPGLCLRGKPSRTQLTGDVGVMVRPLPVVSFAYSAQNVFGVDAGGGGAQTPWRRLQQWGVSYFWQERVVLSFAQQHADGASTLHYGISVKTAVPIELMAGFSNARVNGGVRWVGARYGAVIAFSSDEAQRVTWTAGLEIRIRRGEKEGAP